MKRYTADELRNLPTLATGQADDLKVDTGDTRVWLCRCGVADGMPYENAISVESLVDGQWVDVEMYRG